MWEKALGADSPPPPYHGTNQDPREKRSGFFLRSSPLIAAICNDTGWPPGALPDGFMEGGVGLWGTLDPVCAGYQLHLTCAEADACRCLPPVLSGHRIPVGWGMLRLWDPHPRATAPPERAGM